MKKTLLAAVLTMFGLAAAPVWAADTTTDVEGTVEVVHSDNFASKQADFKYYLKTQKAERLEMRLKRGQVSLKPGEKVKVHGTKQNGVVEAADASGIQQTAPAPVAATTGTKKVAVVMINFADRRTEAFTADAARGVVFTNNDSVKNYYAEDSRGKLNMTGKLRSDGDVFGWYQIPASSAGCNYTNWASQANSAASAAGVDLSGYDNIIYAFPRVSSCGWAGLAYVPGSQSFINGELDLRVVGHELGHNYGSHHANSYTCTLSGVRVAISNSCTSDEYGDPFDIMGSGDTRHHNNFNLGRLGFLDAGNTSTPTTDATYNLVNPESVSTGVQALRIPRGNGTYYYIEYRQPWASYFDNFSASDPVVNGLSIRIAPDYNVITQPLLVDTTPQTSTFTDAPLALGKTFTDPATNLNITFMSADPTGAQVKISHGSTGGGGDGGDTIAPTKPGSIWLTNIKYNQVTVNWNKSTDNVGVTGYSIYRNGTKVGTSTALNYTDVTVLPGTAYSYAVAAVDAAGNESPKTNNASTTTPKVGSITGKVTDAGGVGLPGVSLKVTNIVTNQLITLTTDQNGNFTAAGLPASTYRIDVSKAGYQPLFRYVGLSGGTINTQNFILKP